MTPNASQPILSAPTHLLASPWLANDLSVKSLIVVILAVLIFTPKFVKVSQGLVCTLIAMLNPGFANS